MGASLSFSTTSSYHHITDATFPNDDAPHVAATCGSTTTNHSPPSPLRAEEGLSAHNFELHAKIPVLQPRYAYRPSTPSTIPSNTAKMPREVADIKKVSSKRFRDFIVN